MYVRLTSYAVAAFLLLGGAGKVATRESMNETTVGSMFQDRRKSGAVVAGVTAAELTLGVIIAFLFGNAMIQAAVATFFALSGAVVAFLAWRRPRGAPAKPCGCMGSHGAPARPERDVIIGAIGLSLISGLNFVLVSTKTTIAPIAGAVLGAIVVSGVGAFYRAELAGLVEPLVARVAPIVCGMRSGKPPVDSAKLVEVLKADSVWPELGRHVTVDRPFDAWRVGCDHHVAFEVTEGPYLGTILVVTKPVGRAECSFVIVHESTRSVLVAGDARGSSFPGHRGHLPMVGASSV